MDFRINPENEDLLERAKIYAKEILAPRAEEIDQEGIFPRENFNDLAKEGFTSLTIPKDQGGRDLYEDTATYSMVLYELVQGLHEHGHALSHAQFHITRHHLSGNG